MAQEGDGTYLEGKRPYFQARLKDNSATTKNNPCRGETNDLILYKRKGHSGSCQRF